jgi:hypothetical protein
VTMLLITESSGHHTTATNGRSYLWVLMFIKTYGFLTGSLALLSTNMAGRCRKNTHPPPHTAAARSVTPILIAGAGTTTSAIVPPPPPIPTVNPQCRPHRQRQPPVRFQHNDPLAAPGADIGLSAEPAAAASEYFDMDAISNNDEEEEDPAPTTAPVQPSPFQTSTNTAQSDPLATGMQPKWASADDVHVFFKSISAMHKTCILCE